MPALVGGNLFDLYITRFYFVCLHDCQLACLHARPLLICPRLPADAATRPPQRNKGVDVCVAVATDGGLLTPIIKGADALGLVAINEAVKDLAARARIGELWHSNYVAINEAATRTRIGELYYFSIVFMQ